MQIQKNISLAPYTSWQIGGPAEFFCLPLNIADLKEAFVEAKTKNWKTTILGGGSNVLISDEGVPGLVICLRKFEGLRSYLEKESLYIEAWAGTSKTELLKVFLKHQLAPALFLAGLPGDVGGGVVMNAGVSEGFSPREFGEMIEWVEVLRTDSLCIDRIPCSQIAWSYRHSEGWQPGVVVRAGFRWPLHTEVQILEKVKQANKSRLSKQPLDWPSCGSVFVNPPGHKAAQLIEQCGMKGHRVGDAQVSLKHSNFIVNLGKATAKDVMQVIRDVQMKVQSEKSVQLKTEVVLLGPIY